MVACIIEILGQLAVVSRSTFRNGVGSHNFLQLLIVALHARILMLLRPDFLHCLLQLLAPLGAQLWV